MKHGWIRWWWALLLVPMAAGLARLHFDADVLSLLPSSIPAVQGLKLYQQHFANARQLIITVRAPDADAAKSAAQSIVAKLRQETNLVADATWQPPWLEHPEQMAELIGYLWLNQPPEVFSRLAGTLAESNLASVLIATRESLATTLSPGDMAQLSYDPFGLTRLPPSIAGAAPGFGQGQGMFASSDGTFRIIFVKAAGDLDGYRECIAWLDAVEAIAQNSLPPSSHVQLGYTGRPAFVAEISAGMKHDVILSVGGTALIIAILFWLAHRRWKPMLWLLTLLALILGGTLALGSLILGAINVVSMGFAAILLGLAVDYAVVHYQEALAYPDLSVPEIRRAIAPSIFWAAATTISAFLALNFGGLPGLAQLGSLVAIGIALSALVMIMAFLPPLFPDRMALRAPRPSGAKEMPDAKALNPLRAKLVFAATGALMVFSAAVLSFGWPKMDASSRAMEPRHSQAYAALEAVQKNLSQNQEPLWLVVSGRDESEVARRLDAIKPALDNAASQHLLTGFTLPDALWPRPDMQSANRATARRLAGEADALKTAALSNGFTGDALALSGKILETWRQAAATTNVFWPTNAASQWIFEKISAHDPQGFFAAGFLYPAPGTVDAATLARAGGPLAAEGIQLSSWSLLGRAVLDVVKHNMWKMLPPMGALVLLSLWLAFGRMAEICLSLGVLLLSGFCLLAMMKLAGWSWNVLNLMALPLLLGTGVDYSLFMQLALRRHGGSLQAARHSVGRALLLCGGAAVAAFGSLGFSSNAGMSSLGLVCATGLACNLLISIFLLPVWWKIVGGQKQDLTAPEPPAPSQLYRGVVWKIGLALARHIPAGAGRSLARCGAAIYWRLAGHRRKVVIQNLRPVVQDDESAARAARALFTQFALKIADLWRYESGVPLESWVMRWKGWEVYSAAMGRGRGVLLVTPHLGNWEMGGAFLPRKGIKLLVLTQPEPDPRLTALRQAARASRGVETIVVGEDAFAFIEIVKRLQEGATVALLMDRPAPSTAVAVNLFGRPFSASIAAAELARASGCAILPSVIVRTDEGYAGEIQPEIPYDRAIIGNRAARIRLTQEIMRVFEPAIKQHITQWYHFVSIWPPSNGA
ncbi:MAG: MMPL family transporter [Verrucomicrobiota bacterium]|jgi:predicted exporter/lauroyl/myristoyl acyltransferase